MKPYRIVKKAVDFIFALILILVFSPVMLLVCISIKVDSRGPVLFKQKRPGKDGRIFTVYKFRTMKVETESAGKVLTDMERMTGIGPLLRKTSLDELPQLFNILQGEMSFIGPRPLLVEYLPLYSPEQSRRHEVAPGITGWAQVNGRNSLTWEHKFELDVWYVDNMSFIVDLKIVWMTIRNVLSGKDVNRSATDTMPRFRGKHENKQESL